VYLPASTVTNCRLNVGVAEIDVRGEADAVVRNEQ
jgi:hypothetical protein